MRPIPSVQLPALARLEAHRRRLWPCALGLIALWLAQYLASALQPSVWRPHVSANAQGRMHMPFPAEAPTPIEEPVAVSPDTDLHALLETTLPQFDIDPTELPQRFRKHLVKRIHEYAVLYHAEVQSMLARAAPYVPIIRLILQSQGLREYFAYLPLTESAFQVDTIHPKSGAAGLWQLMDATARGYGLRVTPNIDERLEPIRATRAAASYLRELQDMFGAESPLLLLAAYNYGENNLSKAITRARTRDIWELFRARHIPYQTREYLIKMVTLWVVVAHAERFGFPPEDATLPSTYMEVTYQQPVLLATVASQLQMPLAALRTLNPHLLTARVPAKAPIHIPSASLHKSVHVEVRLSSPVFEGACCARLHLIDSPPLAQPAPAQKNNNGHKPSIRPAAMRRKPSGNPQPPLLRAKATWPEAGWTHGM